MNRRSFIASILAAGVAPAVVGSGVLMPVRKMVVPSDEVFVYRELINCSESILRVVYDGRVRVWTPHGEVDLVEHFGSVPRLGETVNIMIPTPVWRIAA